MSKFSLSKAKIVQSYRIDPDTVDKLRIAAETQGVAQSILVRRGVELALQEIESEKKSKGIVIAPIAYQEVG